MAAGDTFAAVPTRSNGQKVLASWWNLIRTAGIALEAEAPRWDKLTFTHTQFQTAGLVQTIELVSLVSKGVLDAFAIQHTTAFAGTGITAYSIQLGITGTLDKFSGAFDILQATGNQVGLYVPVGGIENFGAATSLKITATAVGANLDQSSAGSVDVYVLKSTLPAT